MQNFVYLMKLSGERVNRFMMSNIFIASCFHVWLYVSMVDGELFPIPSFTVNKSDSVLKPGDFLLYSLQIKDIFCTSKTETIIDHGATVINNHPAMSMTGIWIDSLSRSLDWSNSGSTRCDIYGDGACATKYQQYDLMCLNETVNNYVNFNIKMRMGDNPEFDNGLSIKPWIAVNLINEYIFVYEGSISKKVDLTKEPRTSIYEFHNDQSFPLLRLPSTPLVSEIRIEPISRLIRNVTMTWRFPNTIDMEQRKIQLYLNPDKFFTKRFIQEHIDTIKKTVTVTMPYLDTFGFYQFNLEVMITSKLFTTQKPHALKYLLDISYCEHRNCDSTTTNTIKTVSMEIVNTIQPSPALAFSPPIFIKKVKTGRCWIPDETQSRLQESSNCKKRFRWWDNGTLSNIETGKFVDDRGMLSTYSSLILMYYNKYLMSWKGKQDLNVWARNGQDVIDSQKISNGHIDYDPTKQILILKAWDNTEDIISRSILYEAPTEPIFICNPNGDLGNRPNCFYTEDKGHTWNSLPSAITFIVFKTRQSNILYGKCHRGKMFCSFRINQSGYVEINFLRQVMWNEARFNEVTIEIHNLDDEELVFNEGSEVFAGEVQASSLGILFYKNETWTMVFYWAY